MNTRDSKTFDSFNGSDNSSIKLKKYKLLFSFRLAQKIDIIFMRIKNKINIIKLVKYFR